MLFDIQTIRTIHAFSICTQLSTLSQRRGQDDEGGRKREGKQQKEAVSTQYSLPACVKSFVFWYANDSPLGDTGFPP